MIINLISSPRNISTALMYSFAHRSDTKVMDEPFYAYYLNLTNAEHPGKEEIIKSQPTSLAGVREWIAHTASQHEVVFIKNMAHHLVNMDYTFLQEYMNVFLIRNPEELISSFAKVIPNPTMTDIGVKKQRELYDFLSKYDECPVIDSSDILDDPKSTLSALCTALRIPFEETMTYWEAGPIAEDGIWAKYWYNNVHASSGFERKSNEIFNVPAHLLNLLEESLPYYEKMKMSAINR